MTAYHMNMQQQDKFQSLAEALKSSDMVQRDSTLFSSCHFYLKMEVDLIYIFFCLDGVEGLGTIYWEMSTSAHYCHDNRDESIR
jgi:hypothetical protein